MLLQDETHTMFRDTSIDVPTYTIQIDGVVQGVGFRPYAYRLAKEFALRGVIYNNTKGLRMDVQGDKPTVDEFYQLLIHNAPKEAHIYASSLAIGKHRVYEQLEIVESETDSNNVFRYLTADLAMCDNCREELLDPMNRRFGYPFITCTDCGPRYSIIRRTPYDREHTSMEAFSCCEACLSEYEDPSDRRFHSQTNSCEDCGIHLTYVDIHGKQLQGDDASLIEKTVAKIQAGGIVAVKGIGGFLLLADATSESTIDLLRRRKHRPAKPFAVLYPDIDRIEEDYVVGIEEREALCSAVAPIVLLKRKAGSTDLAFEKIAPGLSRIGILLPYAPLLQLIVRAVGKPLIATSANFSGESLIYQNDQAYELLGSLADAVLSHDREIVMPQDDSVMFFTTGYKTPIILRHARGMSPHYFPTTYTGNAILATGALMKSSFALAAKGGIYVSQYLGNTMSYEAQQTYKTVVTRLSSALDLKYGHYVADLHLGYFSTQYAMEQAERQQFSIDYVPHHMAHFAAIMEEYALWDKTEDVLGIIWDGTGLGTDGHIWGGEFFCIDKGQEIHRLCHLENFDQLLGDKMALEPRIAALSVMKNRDDRKALLGHYFDEQEWLFYEKLLAKGSAIKCSSMGRLFDAVAALLGLCGKQSFEGEAALLLEQEATAYYQDGSTSLATFYKTIIRVDYLCFEEMLNGIVQDLNKGVDKKEIAFKFHLTLVKAIGQVADRRPYKHLVCSGGVFQNALLVDLIQKCLSDRYRVYFHAQLSPNDENIAFGQLAFCIRKLKWR